MTVLTDAQVYALARAAGFPLYAAQTMTAIVLAEHRGNPDPAALGDKNLTTAYWGPSVGLGQIRSVKAESGTGKSRDATKLTDPLFNLKAAYAISLSGVNFIPWTTYKDGLYKQYLARATAARMSTDPILTKALAEKKDWLSILIDMGITAIPGGGLVVGAVDAGADDLAKAITATVGDPLAAAKEALALAAKVGAWMGDSHNWARVAMVVAGAAGVLAGLTMLAKAGAGPVSTVAGAPARAAKAAASVVPAGRVAKIAGTAAKAAKAAKK